MRIAAWTVAAATLGVVGCATAGRPASRQLVAGVRFGVGTAETPAPARGALGMFDGLVEFAAGRGRLDVTASRAGPTIDVQGVTIAPPLADPGDYYLFDSTGFVLVRPGTRTFSSFRLVESSYWYGDVRDPREGMMEFARLRADTIAAGDSSRLTRHGPFTVRWHLDRVQPSGPVRVLARGWIELPDAPAGEASVVRWFGAAAALATMPDSVGALPPDSLQVTTAVVFLASGAGTAAPGSGRRTPVNLIVLHALAGMTTARIAPERLVLPAAYIETPWPGVGRASQRPPRADDSGGRWREFPAPSPE
jgi:hypothetical protein